MAAVVTQRDFVEALFDAAHDVPAGLRVGSGVDPRQRFAVHRNNAVVSLVNALADAFPVTQALVGEAFFRAMARERVITDPPRSPILADYGDGFAEFIARFPPAAGVAYLADVARLERLRVLAYHAADAAPVAIAEYQMLVAVPARLEATRLRLHPACHWLRSNYAVGSIWHAHQRVDDLADANLSAIEIDEPEDVLVTRAQWDVQVTVLPAGAITWLDALSEGLTLGAAMARIECARGANLAAPLEAMLTLIIEHGLAVALDCPTENCK
ncbi:MAG: HvfC/BufC family peptide modification chaperone [Lysobacter sp.]